MADYLKFKSWYLEYPVSNPVVEDTEQFLELAVDIFLKMKPFNDYLNQALAGLRGTAWLTGPDARLTGLDPG